MYKGQKCCAGCQVSGAEKHRESVNTLCNECQRFLEVGRGTKPDEAGFTYFKMNPNWGDSISLTNNKTRKHLERTGALVSILDEGKSPKDEKLMTALYKFLRTISVGAKNEYDYDMVMMRCGYYDKDIFILRNDVALSFLKFYEQLSGYSQDIYEKGVRNGSNLLMSLHTGKITMKNFEDNL